jgi:CheY-like chemotaxis protein
MKNSQTFGEESRMRMIAPGSAGRFLKNLFRSHSATALDEQKGLRVAILLLLLLAVQAHAQPTQNSANLKAATTSSTSTPPSAAPAPPPGVERPDAANQADEFVKFSSHVREETAHQTDQLFRLLTVLGVALGFLGASGFAGLWLYGKKLLRLALTRLEQQYNRTLEERVNDEISVFHEMFDKRQKKYSETLQAFFRKLFVAAPQNVQEAFLGIDLSSAKNLEKKSILWVEDDPIGIALFVALASHFGATVHVCQSTEEALRHVRHGRDADLVVSNMNRRESDGDVRNAGLQLASCLWKDYQKGTVIFTRPKHAERLKSEIENVTDSGVPLEVVTDESLLFATLVRRLVHA